MTLLNLERNIITQNYETATVTRTDRSILVGSYEFNNFTHFYADAVVLPRVIVHNNIVKLTSIKRILLLCFTLLTPSDFIIKTDE